MVWVTDETVAALIVLQCGPPYNLTNTKNKSVSFAEHLFIFTDALILEVRCIVDNGRQFSEQNAVVMELNREISMEGTAEQNNIL